jgi:hypothetical protein
MILETDFDFELEIGKHIVEVNIQASIEHVIDNNYGADADGNRGIRAIFTDIDWIAIRDKRGNDITDKVLKKYPKEYNIFCDAAIELALEQLAEDKERELDDYNDTKYNEYKDNRYK